MVLEKTPHNVGYVPLILRVYPQATFIHLIRDPRAVCSSLRAAARSWGRYWAPESVVDGARMWRSAVEAGWDIPNQTHRYIELRYCDLREDPVARLRSLFDWLEVEANDVQCRGYVEACSLDRLRKGGGNGTQVVTPTVNSGQFYRRGESESWRDELTPAEIRRIEYVAGEALQRAGYEPVFPPAGNKPLRIRAKDALNGLRWNLDALLGKMAARL